MLRTVPAVVASLVLAATATAQDHADYHGEWSGPFLFYIAQQDTGAQGAPEVYDGRLRIDSEGRIQGEVPEAACALRGSSMDYVSPANASVELDLSGCRDARFNGHFSGKLINNPILKYASLRMSSMRSLDAGTAQISAVIRR